MEQQFLQREESGAEAAHFSERRDSVDTAESVVVEGEEAVSTLLAAFQKETRRYKQRLRNALALGMTAAASVTLLDTLALAGSLQSDTFPFAMALLVWGIDLLVLCSCIAYPLRAFRARKQVAGALAQFDDVRVVGPLAEMLEMVDRSARPAVAEVLTHLLPRLQASDAALLDAEQRACLCRVLNSSERTLADLKIAILKAFEQVGDSKALPVVERLADSLPWTETQRRVRAAARQCLPFLKLRAEQEPFRQMLLRASAAQEAAPDELLRPAVHSRETAPELLLRASAPNDEA